jgi:hypothetical protein
MLVENGAVLNNELGFEGYINLWAKSCGRIRKPGQKTWSPAQELQVIKYLIDSGLKPQTISELQYR